MIDFNIPLFLVILTTFCAGSVIVWFLFLKPLLAAMNARRDGVRSDLDEAKKAREEAEKLQEKLGDELRKAREQIKKDLEAARGQGDEERKKIKERAAAEADELLEKARQEIGSERDKAVKALRAEAGELGIAIAEKLISAEVDAEKHKKLIDEMVGKI